MRQRARVAVAGLSLGWVAALVVALVGDQPPSVVRAADVSARERKAAVRHPARLPVNWPGGRGRPPLVATEGRYFVRDEGVVLAGTALLPGVVETPRFLATVTFEVVPFEVYGRLGGPLLPFMPRERPDYYPAARRFALGCGLGGAEGGAEEGLYAVWDGGITVCSPDGVTPLFPGRSAQQVAGSGMGHTLAIRVDGERVIVSLDEGVAFDFHAEKAPVGCVGVMAAEGAATIQRLEVSPLPAG
jgi:hypothetical protein